MLKKSFFNRQETAVAALFKGETVEDLTAQARTAEFNGADAIAAELCILPPELRTKENFRIMMDAVKLPFMFILYRSDRWFGKDDDARQKFLLDAAEAGAEVVDVMGDLYDPSEFELTRKPEAVKKQMALIDEIHARGAKVVMSSHMAVPRSAEQVLEHLERQSERGADLLKIVTGVNSEAEFIEAVRTTLLLRRKLEKPFIHLCNGSWSRLHRFIGPKLGVAVTFAVNGYSRDFMLNNPTIPALQSVLRTIPWTAGE